jgi:putative endonuclease
MPSFGYMLANDKVGTLYTGVTAELAKRLYQHKDGTKGFTARYNVKRLVWY